MVISMLEDMTMTAKGISDIPRTVVTMATVPCTSILTLVMGFGEYNMTPCHGGDRRFKSARGRQSLVPSTLIPTKSYEKPILKLYQLKLGTWPPTTPNFSYSYHPYPTRSYLTSGTIVVSELMVTSLTSSPGRLHHEDRTSTPRIPRQPRCG